MTNHLPTRRPRYHLVFYTLPPNSIPCPQPPALLPHFDNRQSPTRAFIVACQWINNRQSNPIFIRRWPTFQLYRGFDPVSEVVALPLLSIPTLPTKRGYVLSGKFPARIVVDQPPVDYSTLPGIYPA